MPVGNEGRDRDGVGEVAACLARLCLPLDDRVLTADPSAENRAWLRARHPGLPQQVVDPAALRAAILARHGAALKRHAVEGLSDRLPELSARRVLTPAQGLALLLLAAAALALLLRWPLPTLHVLIPALSAAFVASGLFRAWLAWIGARAPEAQPALPRRGLPRYTILVPMYREAAVLPGLVRALHALDYPSIMQQAHLRTS